MKEDTQQIFLKEVIEMNLVKYTREITNELNLNLSMREVERVAKILYNLSMGYAGKLNYLGEFTGYVYREDFMKAFKYADATNIKALPIYMYFIYYEVPIILRNQKS